MKSCLMCKIDEKRVGNFEAKYTIENFNDFHVCEKHLLEAINVTEGVLKVRKVENGR